MEYYHCFCGILGRRKRDKGEKRSSEMADNNKGLIHLLQVKMDGQERSISLEELLSTSFTFPVPFTVPGPLGRKVLVMNHETPMQSVTEEVACEKEERNNENLSMKRENFDLDLQARVCQSNEDNDQPDTKDINLFRSLDRNLDGNREAKAATDARDGLEMARSEYFTDPGICGTDFWPSARLTRSHSDLGLRDMIGRISDQLPLMKSQSFIERLNEENLQETAESPYSAVTHWSADKVLLMKHSSTLLGAWDTMEAGRFSHSCRFPSSNSVTEGLNLDKNDQALDGFHEMSIYSPQQEIVTFLMHSPTTTRVDEWVKGLLVHHPFQDVKEDENDVGVDLTRSPEACRSLERSSPHSTGHPRLDVTEENLHANGFVRLLSSSSTVAHIVAVGLKVLPQLSQFTSLRFVNLSNNSIVHIAPGSLPKSLHALNLSRNNINVIVGLRELTRLRVLDLSYNRITNIGQGLSNSRLVKELYLAGNKIGEVDGLHRLEKLAILDLSFNKIATTKALGQLVANYNSLIALNLLGNPIITNISDNQLRKTLCSLLPELTFLNKQPINPQKLRGPRKEGIGKLALGNRHHTIHRKAARKANIARAAALGQKYLGKQKSQAPYHSSSKAIPTNIASSSR